jgi:hypothetical protein
LRIWPGLAHCLTWIRLHEKARVNGEVSSHYNADEHLDAYLKSAGIEDENKLPLLRTSFRKTGRLTENRMTPSDMLRMVKRRALIGILCCPITCSTSEEPNEIGYVPV